MLKYLAKVLYLLLFGLLVIGTYYGDNFNFHRESFDGYTGYVLCMLFFYGLYKGYNYIVNFKKIPFSPLKIFGFFLLHLFLLCVLFFSLGGNSGGLGITLFFKILGFLFIPTLIVFSSISFGKFLVSQIKGFEKETSIFQFILSLGVGFFVFSTALSLLGFIGFYTLSSVFLILTVMVGVSYKQMYQLFLAIYNYKIEIDNHDFTPNSSFFAKINLNLLTTEFFFIVATFLISVNFISIVRPMPIGWDDLGVYMNYPNLMAAAGQILPLGMAPWQVFTGIGYMFGSATQSFFMNNVGGVLSFIIIVLSFKDLLASRMKTFVNIPLLAGTMFLAMPMVVFQQAKDMKLDPGLFFVSAIVIYLTIYLFTKYMGYTDKTSYHGIELIEETSPETEEMIIQSKKGFFSYFSKHTHIGQDIFSNTSYLIYILIIGILAGFAFSIKITSLLLISGILGIFFYSKLGMAGLISYFSIYVGIFTKLGLWDMMFVVYPKDDMNFRNTFFLYSLVLGGILLSYSIYKYNFHSFKKLILLSVLFLIGVGIGFAPWATKNIIESKGELSIGVLLNGKPESFNLDYSRIYSKEEVEEINKKNQVGTTISASGTTTNEDMGRYFGYEKGVNNYIKLPYNLTMQVNQRGEFTDITYYYLAFIPAIVLFLAFQVEVLAFGVFLLSLIPLVFFFNASINTTITNILTQYNLPGGYIILALLFFVPFVYMMYALNREKLSIIFKLNLVFALFYIFLWSISAFGIVWYGVAMYYNLLLIIGIGVWYITRYDPEGLKSTDFDINKELIIRILGSFVVLFIGTVYIFNSVFPHGFSNLRTSGYDSYKANITNNYISIFDSHSDYYDALSELNIKKEKQQDLVKNIISKIQSDILKKIIENNNITTLIALNNVLVQISNDTSTDVQVIKLKAEVKELRTQLYKMILYPTTEYKNDVGIYRIGTFLRFFIADNHKRLLEDSLVDQYYKYFYNKENLNSSVEKMKKMGVNYFLVDLNAATIDRDPRHDLTNRYESLLHTFTSDKLELIQTDSMCLKIALEDYNKSQKTSQDFEKYIRFAGVNYESYTASGEVINRGVKELECYNYILDLISSKKVNEKDYNYLIPIVNYLNQNKMKSQEELLNFFRNYVGHGWMVLFRIK